ncbi:MAG TPA: hypothetical protein VGN34_30730 [Ktedonobacteraceae bacterium]|jgi:hypothetical protein
MAEQKAPKMSLEDQIKIVAGRAARDRWDMQWPWPDFTSVTSIDENAWTCTYIEPDTGTEEDVTVERAGNELQARAWSQEKPHVFTLE